MASASLPAVNEQRKKIYPQLDEATGNLANKLANTAREGLNGEDALKNMEEDDPEGDYRGIEVYTPTSDFSSLETQVFPPLDVEALELAREGELVLFAVAKDVIRVRNEMQHKHASAVVSGGNSLSFVTLQAYAVKIRRETADFATDLQDFKNDYLVELTQMLDTVSSCKPILEDCLKSITWRLHSLQSEVLHTSSLADKMIEDSRRMVSVARKEIIDVEQSKFLDDIDTPLNDIKVSWEAAHELQNKVPQSRRAGNFIQSMKALNMPVCNDAYMFIQSPEKMANTLQIAHYSFAPKELSAILAFLCAHPRMHRCVGKLVLFDCKISDNDCKNIATAIKYMPLLSTISLKNNDIGDEGATCIATALWETGKTMRLQTLALDHNHIGPEGTKALASAIVQCNHLMHFSIGGNPILDPGLFYILQSLLNPRRKAYQRFKWYSPEDDDGIDDLDPAEDMFLPSETDGTAEIRPLQTSVVNWRDTANAAVEADVREEKERREKEEEEKMKEEKARESLPLVARLRKFRVAVSCVTAFLSLQHRGLPLSSLNVSRCGITKLSGAMIAAFLKEHRSLGTWVLDYNELGDEFVTSIVEVVEKTAVVSLSLKGCQITDVGVESLVHMASRSEYLTDLDLSLNQVGNVGAAWLASLSMKYVIDHARIGRRSQNWKPPVTYIEQPQPIYLPPPQASEGGSGAGSAYGSNRSWEDEQRSLAGPIATSMRDAVPFADGEWEAALRDVGDADARAIDDELISMAHDGKDLDQMSMESFPIDSNDCMVVPEPAQHIMEWSILAEFLAKQRDRGKAISLQAYKFLRERLIWERQLRSVKRDGMIDLQAHYYGTEIGRGVDEEMIDIL